MKKFKPTTPSRRQQTSVFTKEYVTGDSPHKSLTSGFRRAGGRNSYGRITSHQRSVGHKRRYRSIDFKYDKQDIPATVETIEYDPNRSGFIGILLFADGERRYALLPQKVSAGDEVIVSENAPVKLGNRLILKNIPVGTFVYNVEVKPGGGAKLGRSAGTYLEVLAKDAGYVDLKMPSGEIRKVIEKAYACVGEVSNPEHKLRNIGKAGRNRWLGRRPKVRGAAMNSVDHPMGGGEARSRGKRKHIKTRWGKVVDKGKKTRRPKKYSNSMIVSRRKNKRRS